MGKSLVTTPVYFSFAWALMITYQLYTETAVKTVISELLVIWPQLGNSLSMRVDLMVFFVAFSWVYVLSSVIPSLLLGKNSGIMTQFLLVLALTSSTLFIKDLVVVYTGMDINRILSLSKFLTNPLDAVSYLVLPYIVMIFVDKLHPKNSESSKDSAVKLQ